MFLNFKSPLLEKDVTCFCNQLVNLEPSPIGNFKIICFLGNIETKSIMQKLEKCHKSDPIVNAYTQHILQYTNLMKICTTTKEYKL